MREHLRIRYYLLGVVAVIAFCTSAGSEEYDRVPERGGWITSGRTVPLPPGRVRADPSPSGALTDFGPARRLQALLFENDTLWIGTEGGLFAYVPEADTLFEIGSAKTRSVTSIASDDAGALWVGGDDGVGVRVDGSWMHYGARQHRIFSRVTEIVPGDGRMWIGTYGEGCGYVTADSIRSFSHADSLFDDRVLAIAEENPHVVWFGTASGLCMADTLHWESMRYGNRIPIGAVEDMLFDEAGDLFLAVTRQGVVRYSLGRVQVFGPRDGIPGREINAFSLDPTGRMWVAGNGGVSIYDGSGWVPYRLPGVPPAGYRYLSVCHDIEGGCYLGTDSGVLLVLSREQVREVRVPQRFPDSQVNRIFRFGEVLWFLTGRGIYRMQRELREITPPGGWFIGAMADFTIDREGGLWVATRFGILHHLGQQWEVFDRRQGLPTEHFVAAAPGRDGELWFGTFDCGILRLTATGWIHYTEANGLPGDRIVDLLVDGRGTPWVVAGEGELARFKDDTWERIALPQWQEPQLVGTDSAEDSTRLLDPAIRFLTVPGKRHDEGASIPRLVLGLDGSDRCIIAMGDGIYQFLESGWRVIGTPDQERGIDPTAVLVSRGGRIWLGTARSGVFVHERGDWWHLGTEHGLTDDHILSIAEDAAGNIWIGTRFGGLNRFTPDTGF